MADILSFSFLPRDMLLREIRPHLDNTSRRQWRATERYTASLYPVPLPTVAHWELTALHTANNQYSRRDKSVFNTGMFPFIRVLDQAIYDDHGGVFLHYWPIFERWVFRITDEATRWDYIKHVLYAAASGNARRTWRRIWASIPGEGNAHQKCDRQFEWFNKIDLACHAISFGHWSFAVEELQYNEKACISIVLADHPPEIDRHNSAARPSCIQLMLARHHFTLFDEKIFPILFKDWDPINPPRPIMIAALRHGHVALVDSHAFLYDLQDLHCALDSGTRIEAIALLCALRPDLMVALTAQHKKKGKKLRRGTDYVKSGAHPPILEWLVNHGLVADTMISYEHMAMAAYHSGKYKMLRWIHERLKDREDLPEWYTSEKYFNRKSMRLD